MNKKILKLWKLYRHYSKIRKGFGLIYLQLHNDGSGSLHGSSIRTGSIKLQSWNCAEAGISTMQHLIDRAEKNV